MLRNLGPFEILLILGFILLMFGGKKIPELMHGLGKGINEFKRATTGDTDEKTTTPEAPKA
jgi:sec-independent protein translocase protein TatA